MLATSEAFKTSIKQPDRGKNLKIYIETAFETFDLGKDDVKSGSLKIDESAVSGDTFSVGGTSISNLELTLFNTDNRFDEVQLNGAIITIQDGTELPDGTYEYVPLGVFNIDDVSRPTDVETIQGSDNMILLDIDFKDVNVPFPISCKNLLTEVCSHCHLPLSSTDFYNSDYIVQARPTDDMSCRDVVRYIAAIAAGYAHCTRVGGMLEIKSFKDPKYVQEAVLDGNTDTASGGDFDWINNKSYDGGVFSAPSPDVTLTTDNRFNFKIDDHPIQITGITYKNDDKTYQLGSPLYSISMAKNPLIQDKDPTDILNLILDKLFGFTYLPFTSDWQGDPSLECGDIVEQIDRKGNHYRTIVTNSSYAFHGNCKISAKGASPLANGYRSPAARQISTLQRKIVQKQQQIDALDDAIANASMMITGIWGGYYINGDALADEKYHGNRFICDNIGDDPTHPDVTKAVKVWRWNLGGFGYSESGVNGPYTTAITADNSIVTNLITASMIKTGILQSLNGKSWIDLDSGAFSFGKGTCTYDDATGIKSTHLDGSYTTLNGSGLLHHNGSNNSEYHYLSYTGKATISDGDTLTITLPDGFKGKSSLTISLSLYSTPYTGSSAAQQPGGTYYTYSLNALADARVWITSQDDSNATFTVSCAAKTVYLNMEDGANAADEDGSVLYPWGTGSQVLGNEYGSIGFSYVAIA